MTNAQINALIAALTMLVKSQAAPKQTAKQSSYKPKNNFTPKGKILSEGKTERQISNDVKVAKAFRKAGIVVVPRVDALTYKGWLKVGMRVKAGAKGTFVKGVGTLFHVDQVQKDVTLSKAQMTAEVAGMSFPA